jgi:hypothetical protein
MKKNNLMEDWGESFSHFSSFIDSFIQHFSNQTNRKKDDEEERIFFLLWGEEKYIFLIFDKHQKKKHHNISRRKEKSDFTQKPLYFLKKKLYELMLWWEVFANKKDFSQDKVNSDFVISSKHIYLR